MTVPNSTDTRLASLRAVTVTNVIFAARSRGMDASDLLAELFAHAGVDLGKAA